MKRKRIVVMEAFERRMLFAAVISVLNTGDSGADTLRDAIAAASAGDTIDATGITGTITLASPLTIDKDLTIAGPGAGQLSLSGNDAVRVLNVNSGVTAILSNLSIVHGQTANQGAGINSDGNLTLDHVTVSNNTVVASGGSGAGIYSSSSLTLNDSSILSNQITANNSARGAGIYVSGGTMTATRSTIADNTSYVSSTMGGTAWGGGAYLGGTAAFVLTNCTISGNVANSVRGMMGGQSIGGGIFEASNSTLAALNCTFVNNAAMNSGSGGSGQSYGGAMYHYGGTGTYTNCLFSGNTAQMYGSFDTHRAVDGGHNLIDQLDGSSTWANGVNGNKVGSSSSPLDAKIGVLSDNGGPAKTIGLLDASPAIDSADSSAPATDQRGHSRTGAADIGAFEAGPTNHAPLFSTTAVTSATSENAYAYNVVTTDQDGDLLTISSGNTLPNWLTLLDNGDGTATLSGTPVNADSGSVSVKLDVTDGTATTHQNFTLNVAAINHAPALAPAADQTAIAANPYAQTVSATDPDGDHVTISVVSKPDWLTVTDNGDGTASFAGTPGFSDGGSSSVVLKGNDGTVDSAPQTFNINVIAPRWQVANGILSVTGDNSDNNIQVFPKNGMLRVVRDGVIKNFATAGINTVELYGFDGNDTLSLNLKGVAGYELGGAGNDNLTGGDEADVLSGGGGKDSLLGGGGSDRLNGGAGNDRLDGGEGDDRLFGGDANDVLIGNTGVDSLRGEDGDDVIYSRDNVIDLVSGGTGTNFAQIDLADQQAEAITLLA